MRTKLEILAEAEYLMFCFSETIRDYLQASPTSPLDKMIDEATGHDKARDSDTVRELTRLLCRIGSRQKLMGDSHNREITLRMLAKLKGKQQ